MYVVHRFPAGTHIRKNVQVRIQQQLSTSASPQTSSFAASPLYP